MYDKYKTNFFDPNLTEDRAECVALEKINKILILHGLTLEEYNLPSIINFYDDIFDFDSHITSSSDSIKVNTLNKKQRDIFNLIIKATYNSDENQKLIYILMDLVDLVKVICIIY